MRLKKEEKEKILMHNCKSFFNDIKKATEFVVFAERSSSFFKIRKMDVLQSAQTDAIYYYLSDELYKVKRLVMVIL